MSFIYCESIIIASDFCFVYGNRFFFFFYYYHCLYCGLLSCSYYLVYTIFLYCVLHMFVGIYYFFVLCITIQIIHILSEGVNDCCLTPIQQFFSYVMARTS
jgi:hypothetical protein